MIKNDVAWYLVHNYYHKHGVDYKVFIFFFQYLLTYFNKGDDAWRYNKARNQNGNFDITGIQISYYLTAIDTRMRWRNEL